jgi:hypothetical protein
MMNPTRRERLPVSWDAIERYYRTTNIPVTQLARDFAVSHAALRNKIKDCRWTRNHPSPPAARQPQSQALTAALARIVASELVLLARPPKGTSAHEPARAAAIEKLARVIRHISQSEGKDSDAQPSAANPPRVIDDARRLELARRLEGLRRQHEHERNAGRADLA